MVEFCLKKNKNWKNSSLKKTKKNLFQLKRPLMLKKLTKIRKFWSLKLHPLSQLNNKNKLYYWNLGYLFFKEKSIFLNRILLLLLKKKKTSANFEFVEWREEPNIEIFKLNSRASRSFISSFKNWLDFFFY